MPSNNLQSIINQIEQQDTDSFGKFYLYVALLHKVTMHDEKTFVELIPKKQGGFFGQLAGKGHNQLDVGKLSPEITGMVNEYSEQYKSGQYNPLGSVQTIMMAYLRKGKLADLVVIINKMHQHLSVVYEGSLNKNNKSIYRALDFTQKQHRIEGFLGEMSSISNLLLSSVDISGNFLISSVVALVGAVCLLASGLSLLPILVGTTLMVGGALSAYLCFEQIKNQYQQLAEKKKSVEDKVNNFPEDKSFLNSNENHKAFVSSILWPIAYTFPTFIESVLFNDEMAEQAAEMRKTLDLTMALGYK